MRNEERGSHVINLEYIYIFFLFLLDVIIGDVIIISICLMLDLVPEINVWFARNLITVREFYPFSECLFLEGAENSSQEKCSNRCMRFAMELV